MIGRTSFNLHLNQSSLRLRLHLRHNLLHRCQLTIRIQFHQPYLRYNQLHQLLNSVTGFCVISLQLITKNYTQVLRENAKH
jgi:hypothetical protein